MPLRIAEIQKRARNEQSPTSEPQNEAGGYRIRCRTSAFRVQASVPVDPKTRKLRGTTISNICERPAHLPAFRADLEPKRRKAYDCELLMSLWACLPACFTAAFVSDDVMEGFSVSIA